jgi:Transmembrane exosortase (Exosortase_EpsH)
MLSAWRNLRATVPGPFLAALSLGAGYLGFVAWDQSHWWRVKQDYTFGWLVPVFVLFVIRDRWPAIVAQVVRCAAAGSPRALGFRRWLLRAALAASLLGGSLLFLLGAFYRAGAGTSQPGTLALTLGATAILLPLIIINAPDSPAAVASGFRADARLRLASLFLFPVLVWLISAPMVSVVESQLNLALLRQVVSVVAFPDARCPRGGGVSRSYALTQRSLVPPQPEQTGPWRMVSLSLQDPSRRSASVLSFFCYDPETGTTAGNCPLAEFIAEDQFAGGDMTIPMAGSRPPLQPGETAPDFSLPLVSEAGTVSLKDYLGRTSVLLVLLRYIW